MIVARSSSSPNGKPARQWPVRLILLGIVFALVLPGLLFCGILLNKIATTERTRSEQTAQSAATGTADLLDRELSNLVAAMVALSTSPALANAFNTPNTEVELALFAAQARAVSAALGHDIVLSDAEGQQLVNTRDNVPRASPSGTLPRMASMETVREAIRTHTATVSGLFASASDGGPSVAVIVPILQDGNVPAVLGINLRSDYISGVLASQKLPEGWRAAVIDGTDHVFARSEGPGRTLGQAASDEFRAHAAGDHAIWIGTRWDGVPILVAAQRQHLADWRVAVSAPLSIIEAPLRSTVELLVITGVITLAIAVLMAGWLATTLSIPLQRLAAASLALADGRPVSPISSPIAEVNAVSRALVQATQDLRTRADALAAERAQLVAVIETVPVGLVIAEGPQGRIMAGNRHLERILRQRMILSPSVEQYGSWIAHHPDGRLVQPDEYPLARVIAGAAHAELQCIYQCGDGTPRWIQCVAEPIRTEDGTITGGVVAVLDIDETIRAREALTRFTESLEVVVAERTAALEAANQKLRTEMVSRQAVEEQLRQSQKMEAVGQLTGGIAHDFNNLLTIIMGSLDLLRRRAQDDRTKRLLDNALDGTVRAATLTARLLAFSRRQPLTARALDLNDLVAGMSDLLHRTLGESVHLETKLSRELWQVHADANQMENALLNLAVNARDAMGGEDTRLGRLRIETENAMLAPSDLAGDPDVPPGEYVSIAVTDCGKGMSPEIATRVFEPFFTTKPQGQGTGLGLSQVHGFVKQSGGHVAIHTAPGQGTTVRIYLPRYQGVPATGPAQRDDPSLANEANSLTVLVVEDEDAVRRFSTEALQELGHAVLEAVDGQSALLLLDAHPEIDLLFTDVVLPNMNGARLAEEVLVRRPGLPVLFTSGYTGRADGNDPVIAPGSLLLRKPFALTDLADKLRQATAPVES